MSEYLFLEEDSDETTKWVAGQNQIAETALCDGSFETDRDILEAIYKAPDKLVIARTRGGWQYHFIEDEEHGKGLWRRRRVDGDDWLPVFDFDAYCKQADEEWEWRGAITCRWKTSLVLIALSLGGSDQTAYFEFDCDAGEFVDNGFELEAAKSSVSWASCDSLLVAGGPLEDSATSSGWPRVVRHWKRGELFESSPVLFEAAEDDVTAASWCVGEEGNPVQHVLVYHAIGRCTLWTGFLNEGLNKVELSDKVDMVCDGERFAFVTKEADGQWPQGSLVLGNFSGGLSTVPTYTTIVEPEHRCSIAHFFLLDKWLIYSLSNNLVPEIYAVDLSAPEGQAQRIEFPAAYEIISVFPEAVDDVALGNTLMASCSGPLTPAKLFRIEIGESPYVIDETPERFDSTGMSVELLEAKSDDGEMIPYHLVRPANSGADMPTIIYGYGGFNVSISAGYNATAGALWLERGGAYVYAYVRGGGEFGPQWHEDAKGPDNKPVSYMDLAAISRDLVKRGISTPEKIGVTGGSNGGLMVGVMLTNYPKNFGAVWSVVPVLDLKRFATFKAGVAWIDEFGDPENPDDWKKMIKYSPYHLVKKGAKYPPVYFETSATDDRVHPSHARRMVAKMLEQGHTPLFNEASHGGHGGGDLSKAAHRNAMGFRFFQKELMEK